MNSHTRFVWYKHGLGTVAVCIVIGLAFSYLDFFSAFNQAWIDTDVRNQGLKGAAYFMLMASFVTACGAPRQLVAFLGGYAFGFVNGAILATLATVIGCIVTFFAAKSMIRPIIQKKFNRQAKHIDAFLHENSVRKTIIIRLLPLGSNVITNLLAGTTSVKPSAFFIGSAIGYIPQMIIFALLGKGLFIGSGLKITVSIGLLLISSYMSVSLYKKYRRNGAKHADFPLQDLAQKNSQNRS